MVGVGEVGVSGLGGMDVTSLVVETVLEDAVVLPGEGELEISGFGVLGCVAAVPVVEGEGICGVGELFSPGAVVTVTSLDVSKAGVTVVLELLVVAVASVVTADVIELDVVVSLVICGVVSAVSLDVEGVLVF